jgi:hypothetical protein
MKQKGATVFFAKLSNNGVPAPYLAALSKPGEK